MLPPPRLSSVLLLSLAVLAVSAQKPSLVPRSGDATRLPEVNAQVLAFVEVHRGKRVGTGQCWDLAAAALNAAHAKWDGRYGFGTPVDPVMEVVLPGDIIQFEGVLVEHVGPNSKSQESFSHHTAIVQAVLGTGHYTIAHQNFGRAGRKVSLLDLELDHIVKGTFTIYRPGR